MQSVNRLRPSNEISLQAELSEMIAARQQQISTGKRVEKPSQDPAAWSQISDIAKHQANILSWLRNVDRGQTIAHQAERTIGDIDTQLTRAKELLIQANNGTVSAENRELIAIEIDAIGQTIGQLVNSKNGFGADLFVDGEPLKIPIDDNANMAAAPSKAGFSNSITLINNIAEAIRTGDQNTRSAMLTALDNETSTISNLLGKQGIIGSQLEQASSSLKSREIDLGIYRSSVEDADITQSIVSVQKLLVNLQAAQATYAQIEQSSLFDLIR